MNYKKAFQCHKCPQRGDERGCPMWWEIMEVNERSGEQRVKRACGYVLMPDLLIKTVRASSGTSVALESARNEIVRGLHDVAIPVRIPLDSDPQGRFSRREDVSGGCESLTCDQEVVFGDNKETK